MAQHIRGGIKTAKRYPKAEISLHFIIVGGGIAGLATAFALSLVGHRVTVIEESDGRIQVSATSIPAFCVQPPVLAEPDGIILPMLNITSRRRTTV